MIILAILFLYVPAAVAVVVLECVGASLAKRPGRARRTVVRISQAALAGLWLVAFPIAWAERVGFRDWVHLLWSAHVPLVALFVGSGAFLCWGWGWGSRWRSGATAPDPDSPGAPGRVRLGAATGASIYLVLAIGLGVMPIALQLALPEEHPARRETGAPARTLGRVAAWGLGGELPEVLVPTHPAEQERGLGHLPRDITAPLGSTLVAAGHGILFAAIALVGLAIRSPAARGAFYLVAPPFTAFVGLTMSRQVLRATSGFVDLGLLMGQDSRLWECEPALVRSYGPVLLVVAALMVPIVLLLLRSAGTRTRT